jgi:hypothetical protein
MNHNVSPAGWTEAMASQRIADLHREAERERLARQVRRRRARTVALGRVQTPNRPMRGLLEELRRLLRPRGHPGRLAAGREPYAANGFGTEGVLPCQPDDLAVQRTGARTPGSVPGAGAQDPASRCRAIEVRGHEA